MTRAESRSLSVLRSARAGGYAVAAFNAVNLETAQAIVRAAEAQAAPVILQFSQNAARYAGLSNLAAIGATLRADARVPVLLHFDHAEDEATASQALHLGFDGVMLEGDDVSAVARLADQAHLQGGYLEAEYEVVRKGERAAQTHDELGGLTHFTVVTGCDLLAINIGSVHKQQEKTAQLDLDRLAQIAHLTPLPLVLHGASGVPDAQLAEATRRGVSKVNLATDLTLTFTAAVRGRLEQGAKDPRAYLDAGRQAMQARAEQYIQLLGSAGRA